MIVSDKIVFLQLQKSGCTHVERVLNRYFGAEQQGKHHPLPRGIRLNDRKVLSSIRNPWDFYFSLWSFNCMGEGGNYQRATTRRGPDVLWREERLAWVPVDARLRRFAPHCRAERAKDIAFYRNCFADGSDPTRFRAWLRRTVGPADPFVQFPDYGYSRLSERFGLLTFLHMVLACRNRGALFGARFDDYGALQAYFARENTLDDVIRLENLPSDLIRVLRRSDHEVSDEARAKILGGRADQCLDPVARP